MIKVDEYINYFRTAATNCKAIGHSSNEKHFYRMDISEVLDGLRSDINFPALIIENHDGQLSDLESDNPRDNVRGAFVILKKVEGNNNYDGINAVLAETLEIARQVVSKMWKDCKLRNNIMSSLDLNSFTYESLIGNMYDNCFGYRVTFALSAQAKIYFDINEWNNETAFTV